MIICVFICSAAPIFISPAHNDNSRLGAVVSESAKAIDDG